MKYEVSRSNTFRVIALQRSVDRGTDGQSDKVITIGRRHFQWRALIINKCECTCKINVFDTKLVKHATLCSLARFAFFFYKDLIGVLAFHPSQSYYD